MAGKKSGRLGAYLRGAAHKLVSKLQSGLWWPPLALGLLATYWYRRTENLPLPNAKTTESYGQYGDSFGALTSFFTALGFGGLIITIAVQQGQIRKQEEAERRQRQKEERAQYEEILFRLLEIYRQTLSDVRVGKGVGRDVLRNCLSRVDKGIKEEGVHRYPTDIEARLKSQKTTENDRQRMDYCHFRNFKIVAAEINPQGRLLNTFEVLLEHMVYGAPDHLLIDTYKELVFAQITYIECRYYFLVALALAQRTKLRDLLDRSGFLDLVSRSSIHSIHKNMYQEYWGVEIVDRKVEPAMPMTTSRLKRAFRAQKDATGGFSKTYVPLEVRRSLANAKAQTEEPGTGKGGD